ncbi:MAG: hypothetical protein K2M96_00315 [Prevotella sp.]|nr:hypothetical protein [Prevotella sp.]
MKKSLLTCVFAITATLMLAQNDVTKFMGIPVDGYKPEMIKKLQAKGFAYDSKLDYFRGEFNGHKVILRIVTNNNKVWRIVLVDASMSSETDIKIRFNSLCRQFEKTGRYMHGAYEGNYIIPEDEDISYEMNVNKKRYEAAYMQISESNFEEYTTISEQEKERFFKALRQKWVWFMINKSNYREYYISMCYDNMNNEADGEDL